MSVTSRRARATMVMGFACACTVVCVGYALACSPSGSDPWFTIVVSFDGKKLPKGYAVTQGSFRRAEGAPECIFANGRSLDGAQLKWFEQLATHNVVADDRPAHVKLPKSEHIELETYCDPEHYTTEGRIAYESHGVEWNPAQGSTSSPSGGWGRDVKLDLKDIGALVSTRPWWGSGGASGDLYIDRKPPLDRFCTMSAENINGGAQQNRRAFGALSIELTRLAGMSDYDESSYPQGAQGRDPPAPRTFKVFLDCFRARSVVKATLKYTLNKSYDPHAFAKGVAACANASW